MQSQKYWSCGLVQNFANPWSRISQYCQENEMGLCPITGAKLGSYNQVLKYTERIWKVRLQRKEAPTLGTQCPCRDCLWNFPVVRNDLGTHNHADSASAGLGQAQGSVFLTSYQMIPRVFVSTLHFEKWGLRGQDRLGNVNSSKGAACWCTWKPW